MGLHGHRLGDHTKATGLTNQLVQLLGLVAMTDVQHEALSLSTLNFRAHPYTEEYVPFSELWDVSHWNTVAVRTRQLPTLTSLDATRYATNNVTADMFHSSNLWAAYRRGAIVSEQTDAFLRALQPATALRPLIDAMLPGHLGALHARIELDLTKSMPHTQSRTGVPALWSLLRAPLMLLAAQTDGLYVATARSLVSDPKDRRILDEGSSPWASVPLRFGGMEIVQRSGVFGNSSRLFVHGAVVDLFVCASARFFVGARMSSFSFLIALLRSQCLGWDASNTTFSYTYRNRLVRHRLVAQRQYVPAWTVVGVRGI